MSKSIQIEWDYGTQRVENLVQVLLVLLAIFSLLLHMEVLLFYWTLFLCMDNTVRRKKKLSCDLV